MGEIQRHLAPLAHAGLKTLNQEGCVDACPHKVPVNSEIVIAILDNYSSRIVRPAVVVLNSPSPYICVAFCAALERWADRGMWVYHLPLRGLELNVIERFWKELTYQLLPVGAWECFAILLNNTAAAHCSAGEIMGLMSLICHVG